MSSSPGDSEKQPLTAERAPKRGQVAADCFLGYITSIARVAGLAVLAVMWAATVTSLEGNNKHEPTYVRYYLLAASTLVSFFEITWILDKIACCVRQGCCCACWAIVLWVDGWRKFVLYTAVSVPLFLQGLQGIIAVASGFCLLVLACLYLVKSFSYLRKSRQDGHRSISDPQYTSSAAGVRHEMSTQTDELPPAPAFETAPARSPAARAPETGQPQAPKEATVDSSSAAPDKAQAALNPFETDEPDIDVNSATVETKNETEKNARAEKQDSPEKDQDAKQ